MEVIAFYLPQFHPIPENDDWWGPGFTEWTNVTRARPLFRGHVQPHLPADLGFYDLRLVDVRAAQADLARRHGVTAFCYWHYWFAGRRLLERPFDEVLASGQPDLPFCLGWANQSWSGVWHGAPDRVLMEQTYPGGDDDRAHFAYLLKAFTDPRYLRIDGRPLFYLHQPGGLPSPARFVDRWRTMADEAGLPGLYLVASLGQSLYRSHVEDGFDSGVYHAFPFDRSFRTWAIEWTTAHGLSRGPRRYPYRDVVEDPPTGLGGLVVPCVYPNWDNTPRSGRRGVVALGATPERFGAHVRRALELAAAHPPGQQFVFLKSWNEWAEGNYLEPDQEYGRARLEVLDAEIARAGRPATA
jgi:lipopolysaccharide biosynthesis protein